MKLSPLLSFSFVLNMKKKTQMLNRKFNFLTPRHYNKFSFFANG